MLKSTFKKNFKLLLFTNKSRYYIGVRTGRKEDEVILPYRQIETLNIRSGA